MTPEEIDALGVSTDLQTACRAIGISKSSGYAAAKSGKFPCRVIRVGSRYIVPTSGLRELLGIAEGDAA